MENSEESDQDRCEHCSCLFDGYECCWCGAGPVADEPDMDPGDCNDALGG